MNASDKLKAWASVVSRFGLEIDTLVHKILTDNAAFFEELITEDQLNERGVDGTGEPITPTYHPYTIHLKKLLRQTSTHVTLRDTGDFHMSITLEAGPNSFYFKSDDPKASQLARKYGGKIFNLTAENLKSVIWDYVYSYLIEHLKTEIYGTI